MSVSSERVSDIGYIRHGVRPYSFAANSFWLSAALRSGFPFAGGERPQSTQIDGIEPVFLLEPQDELGQTALGVFDPVVIPCRMRLPGIEGAHDLADRPLTAERFLRLGVFGPGLDQAA